MTQSELEAKMKADLESYFHGVTAPTRIDVAEFGIRWAIDNLMPIEKAKVLELVEAEIANSDYLSQMTIRCFTDLKAKIEKL